MSELSTIQVDENAVLEVLRTKNVHTYFQPVVSLVGKSIIGFEAFSRGAGEGNAVVAPETLFHQDLSSDSKVNVDRLCRERALAQFKSIHEKHKNMLLFLNINSEILPHVEVKSLVLKRQVASMDIDMGSVVIECPLSTAGQEDVVRFAARYKELGFKLCLDNCGVDDAFGQILPAIRPSFVKIRPDLYAEGMADENSLQILKSLVELTGRMGAMVIAQGVETEEDSIRLLTAGVHLQQGYYYTKEEGAQEGDPAEAFFRKILNTHEKYKKVGRDLVRQKKMRFEAMFRIVGLVCSKLSNLGEDRFEESCRVLAQSGKGIISLFVLDERGRQITSRLHVKGDGPGFSSTVLGSAKGVDHSVHDYFMYLDMGYEKFVTQPFVSLFTGETGCLISRPIYNSEGGRYVVCVEVPHLG